MNKKYIIAFVCGMLSDFWWCGGVYAVNHNMPFWSFFFNSTFPTINWTALMQAVDETESKERVKLAVWAGLGYGIGSYIFYLITPHL